MKIQNFTIDSNKNVFVVGDLHGQYDAFMKLLDDVGFDKTKDICFSVGDLIDRGPKSQECLLLINEPWFHAVTGNHEEFLTQSDGQLTELWLINGGRWASSVDTEELRKLAEKAQKLPYINVLKYGNMRYNILHAELPVHSDSWIDAGIINEHNLAQLVWGRTNYRNIDKDPEELSYTFVGHTIHDALEVVNRHVYIDSGAAKGTNGGSITLVKLSPDSFIDCVYNKINIESGSIIKFALTEN